MRLRRFEKCGAAFTEDFNSLADLRNRGFTINSSPTEVSMRGKKGIQFDGIDDYIDTDQIHPSTHFSICFWLNMSEELSASGFIFDRDGTLSPRFYLSYNAVSKLLQFTFGAGSHATISDFSLGETIFIAFTYDGTKIVGYKNGVEYNTTAATDTLPNSTGLRIGCAWDTTRYGKFTIQDFMYFPFALTDEDVQAIYNGSVFDYEKHQMGKWEFSEPYVKDENFREFGNDVTSTTVSSSDVVTFGAGKKAVKVTDTDDLTLDMPSELDFATDSVSLIVQVKTNDPAYDYQRVFYTRHGTDRKGYTVRINSGKWRGFIDFGAYSTSILAPDERRDSFKHIGIAFKRDGIAKGYGDGKLGDEVDLSAYSSVDISGADTLALVDLFRGYVQEVKFYHAVLPQLAYKDIYKNKERGL